MDAVIYINDTEYKTLKYSFIEHAYCNNIWYTILVQEFDYVQRAALIQIIAEIYLNDEGPFVMDQNLFEERDGHFFIIYILLVPSVLILAQNVCSYLDWKLGGHNVCTFRFIVNSSKHLSPINSLNFRRV